MMSVKQPLVAATKGTIWCNELQQIVNLWQEVKPTRVMNHVTKLALPSDIKFWNL